MKPINTSIYDFPTLVQTYVYVDKTAQGYEKVLFKGVRTVDAALCEPAHVPGR